MTKYWPMAIIVTEDGPDQLFTYDCALTFEEAENAFDVWENDYKYKIAAKWIDVDNDGIKNRSFKIINLEAVKELWEQFGGIPMNPETECIETYWGSLLWGKHFRPGTHRETIWKWFEETFHVSIARDLMGQ